MDDLGGVLGEVERGGLCVAVTVRRVGVRRQDVVDGRRSRCQRHADGSHQIHVNTDKTLECVAGLSLQQKHFSMSK